MIQPEATLGRSGDRIRLRRGSLAPYICQDDFAAAGKPAGRS